MLAIVFIVTVLSPLTFDAVLGLPNFPLTVFNLIDGFAEVAIWESLGLSNEDCDSLPLKSPDYERDVLFRLFTRNMSSVGTDIQPESLSSSPIDPNAPTKIFIFGFQNELRSDSVLAMKNAYLNNGDYNFIVVDWSKISDSVNYVAARSHSIGVAKRTAKLLDALAESKICSSKDQHIIGHSLGAQIAGMASGAAKTKPGRCTGLDPAGPLFELSTSGGRIDKSVANLVDIIHSAAGSWGLPSPVGHVDFYPNGGTWPQPDCVGAADDIGGLCSHCMSFYYYAYTISHPTAYMARRCQSHRIVHRHCPPNLDVATMGEYLAFEKPGLYYLEARFNLTEP